jgi:hypothetical protein
MGLDRLTQLIVEKNLNGEATNASNEVTFGVKLVSVRRGGDGGAIIFMD